MGLDHQQGEVLTCGTDVTDQHSYFQVDDVAYTVLNINGPTPKPPTSASISKSHRNSLFRSKKEVIMAYHTGYTNDAFPESHPH